MTATHPNQPLRSSEQNRMKTTFEQLNFGWNAAPNVPNARVEIDGSELRLFFRANTFQFPEYDEDDVLQLLFRGCWRYRLGGTNDEGWYMGQCRFGKTIPWGEFYEIDGDLRIDETFDWVVFGPENQSSKHFLFYLRDDTFECDADSWELLKAEEG